MSYGEPSESTNSVAAKILDAAFIVHRELGPGLLESVYETCMADVLVDWDLDIQRQRPCAVSFRGKTLDCGFRTDLIVGDCVIVEIKAVDKFMPVHDAQLLTYLRLTGKELGLLLNFNVPMMKMGIKRLVLSQPRSERSVRSGSN